MCSSKVFDKIVHWTLILIGLVKLILDIPCWYFIYAEQYTMLFIKKELFEEKVVMKIFLGMHLAMLKFIIDVFLGIVLLYACYKKNKGLLILYSTYNAAVGALTIAGMWRVFRNFYKAVAVGAVTYPFSSGPKDSAVAEMYLMFVFVAPYVCSHMDALQNSAVAIFVIEFVLVHAVLPFLVIREIKMVTRWRLENRAILLHLLQNKEEAVPMTTQNTDV